MTVFVVDASVAAKWFLQEAHSDESLALLEPGYLLHAPDYLLVEFDSVVAKQVRRDELDLRSAERMRQAVRLFGLQLHPTPALLDAAFELSCRHSATLHDCTYLALAILLDVEVVSADRKFLRSLEDSAVASYVCWVGDVNQS